MNVNEYTLKFEEGCIFVPFIAENNKDKGEHFLRGLRLEIRQDVHKSKVVTYQDIFERALLAEQEIEKERQLRRQTFQARGQGASGNVRGGHKGKGKMEPSGKALLSSSDPVRPLCPKCGKPHKGECFIGSGRCYICKELGHTAHKCHISSDKGRVQGRIFAMTKEGANPDSSVIFGNILISGKEALTLIDTGVTHSFMSEVFMNSLSVEPAIMPLHFNIMVAFDVILGMDCLSAYRSMIDCVRKTVKFLNDDHESEVFVDLGSSLSIPIISCLQAIKQLNKGCICFLSSVLDVRREDKLQLQDIDVVQDYPDVFANDVPGLPPDREDGSDRDERIKESIAGAIRQRFHPP
ncbi:uncharacterized protein LOC142519701 [Primulina tabacum]|uniref:uncharacterized protein LOC142519701 n=1 Tax=Primulina tabacum TaxID=48773 RepID=UPI003F59275E